MQMPQSAQKQQGKSPTVVSKRTGGDDGDGVVAESKGVHFCVAFVRFQDVCAIRR